MNDAETYGEAPIARFTWPGLATPAPDTRTAIEVAAEKAWASGRHKPTRGKEPDLVPSAGKRKRVDPIQTKFATKKNPFTGDPVMKKPAPVSQNYVDPDAIEIVDDPMPKGRQNFNKYGMLFQKMKPGQAAKVEPEEVGQVANAMRKWLKAQGLKHVVRTVKFYPKDNMGRVWMLDAKGGK